VVAQEHYFVIAKADAFKQSVAIPEGAVVERNTWLINADQVAI
jgi:hypothetical protein